MVGTGPTMRFQSVLEVPPPDKYALRREIRQTANSCHSLKINEWQVIIATRTIQVQFEICPLPIQFSRQYLR